MIKFLQNNSAHCWTGQSPPEREAVRSDGDHDLHRRHLSQLKEKKYLNTYVTMWQH